MNYELAKQLKDAGFPQRSGFHASNAENCNCKTKGLATSCHLAYIPTLSELIEACRENFESLCRVPDGQLVNGETGKSIGVMWRAYPSDTAYYEELKGDCQKECCGDYLASTPEEAVAKLWLALNEKDVPKSPPQTLKSNL